MLCTHLIVLGFDASTFLIGTTRIRNEQIQELGLKVKGDGNSSQQTYFKFVVPSHSRKILQQKMRKTITPVSAAGIWTHYLESKESCVSSFNHCLDQRPKNGSGSSSEWFECFFGKVFIIKISSCAETARIGHFKSNKQFYITLLIKNPVTPERLTKKFRNFQSGF